jgi:hypothetical protein
MNRSTVKQSGRTIPHNVLARANKVISENAKLSKKEDALVGNTVY